MTGKGLSQTVFEEARLGNRQAIIRLIEVTQPDVRRYARSRCRASDEDDATQEVLWQLFRRVSAIRSLAALPSWLFTVVMRECLRLARKGRSSISVPVEDKEAQAALVARPELDLRLDLAAAIEALPGHYRDVVLLSDMQELTVGEVALRLGVTQQAVKARLHRARALMRKQLSG